MPFNVPGARNIRDIHVPFGPAAHYQPRCPACDSNHYHEEVGGYRCDNCGHTGGGPASSKYPPTDLQQQQLTFNLAQECVDSLLT